MFSNGRGEDAPPPYANEPNSPSESSLTSLLPTPAHRVECALMILLCTDELRRNIASTFELPESYSVPTAPETNTANDLISFDNQGIQNDIRALKRDRFVRKQELDSHEIQALKRAAFTYFDAWRGKLLKRACDALNVRPESVRVARKQRVAQASAIAGERKHEDLVDWARTNTEASSPRAEEISQYKGVETKLMKLEEQKRNMLLQGLVLLLLSLETYPAHSRILLLHISSSLRLKGSVLVEHESKIAQGLLEAATQMSGEASRKAVAAENAATSKWKIGLATVAGAALIGVTGGLAAPLLAAGLGTVFGGLGLGAVSGLLGALAGNTLLIGGLFGAYGGKMTGEMMERYEKEVEDFKFLPIRCGSDGPSERNQNPNVVSRRPPAVRTVSSQRHKLRVAIGISGSLVTESDMIVPWSVLDSSSLEPFALRYEVAALLRLGVSLSSVLKSYAWQYAKWEIARRTLFGALAAGLWPLGLLKLARVVDNPFSVAKVRADKAGKVLADALISKCQGERPVTLIGYSLGSRVIYSCLLELAARNAFGLVENVVLMGGPVPSDSDPWTRVRSVVCGRIINVFSTEDYILGFLYRASSAQFDVAGLQAIVGVQGVENFDVSDLISGHTKYRYLIGQILQRVGIEDVDAQEVEKEVAILQALETEETQEGNRVQADADAEAAEIESSIRARVGSPVGGRIVMVDVDEREERRRQELLQVAEEKARSEHDHPPAYEEYHTPSRNTAQPSTSAPLSPSTALPPAPRELMQPALKRHSNDRELPTNRSTPTRRPKSDLKSPPASLVSGTESLHIDSTVESEEVEELEVGLPIGDLEHVEPEPLEDYSESETETASSMLK
jgi:pimeloyl-ACP methyl ester carboxylesterase